MEALKAEIARKRKALEDSKLMVRSFATTCENMMNFKFYL